jgi:hypothetical protein
MLSSCSFALSASSRAITGSRDELKARCFVAFIPREWIVHKMREVPIAAPMSRVSSGLTKRERQHRKNGLNLRKPIKLIHFEKLGESASTCALTV